MAQATTNLTHEQYVQNVRTLAVQRALELGQLTEDEATELLHTKLVYGVGQSGVRGTCYFGTWTNGIGQVDTVEIAAAGQENWVQLAGTTLHELGHVLAGHSAGHTKAWQDACVRLGFTKRPQAAGQSYSLALLSYSIRTQASQWARLVVDGNPAFRGAASGSWLATLLGGTNAKPRPCSAGIGTRGGTSRGAGSGSRMRLYVCQHGQKLRAATDELDVTCNVCSSRFELVTK
jgi:hypothetical protein